MVWYEERFNGIIEEQKKTMPKLFQSVARPKLASIVRRSPVNQLDHIPRHPKIKLFRKPLNCMLNRIIDFDSVLVYCLCKIIIVAVLTDNKCPTRSLSQIQISF